MTQHEPQLNEKALFPGPRGREDARLEQGRAQRVEHAERPAAGEAYVPVIPFATYSPSESLSSVTTSNRMPSCEISTLSIERGPFRSPRESLAALPR